MVIIHIVFRESIGFDLRINEKEEIKMNYVTQQKSEENSFTGLFSILKRYQLAPNNLPILAFEKNDLELIHQFSDNAIKVLLHGLQDVGFLLGSQAQYSEGQINIGFFISSISNLIEALECLRSDVDYMLNSELK